jgi:hypothetical protein
MKAIHLTSFCGAAALAFSINVSAQTGAQQGTSSTTATTPQSSGAQTDTSTTTAGTQQASSSDRVVTFVGCVQKETAALGTSGIGKDNEYVLTDAMVGSADTASASSTSSTAGTPPAVGTSGSESAVPGSESAPAGSASEADAGELDTKMDAPQAADDATASAERDAQTSTGAVGTSGSMSAASHGKIYELTGTREGDMERFVGKRVQITGKLEHDGSAASSSSAASTTQAGDSDRADTSDGSSTGQPADASASQPRAATAGEIDITDVREIGGDCSSPASR